MANPLALGLVCNLQPSPLQKLRAVRELGIPTVQISYANEWDCPQGLADLRQALQETGIEITSVVVSYFGDNYTDVPTVRATVGLVPEATRAERVARLFAASRYAAQLNVPRLNTHIGYIPEDAADARYPALVETVREVCDELATRGQNFALETGQETAPTLRRFIGGVNCPNLRVNFDPANMIMYGNGEPIPALDLLSPWVDGVHCKDGKGPPQPGELGREMPLGQGEVDVPRWIEKLLSVGYRGPLTIERETSGDAQKQDILCAKSLLENCLSSFV